MRVNLTSYPDNLDPQQMSTLNEIQHASLNDGFALITD